MIEDLVWSPFIGFDYEAEFRSEDPLVEDFDVNNYPYLCCDRAFIKCDCKPSISMADHDVKDYLHFNHIDYSDVYDINLGECVFCEFYGTNNCQPLRALTRYHYIVGSLPFFSLTTCKNYVADDTDVIVDRAQRDSVSTTDRFFGWEEDEDVDVHHDGPKTTITHTVGEKKKTTSWVYNEELGGYIAQ